MQGIVHDVRDMRGFSFIILRKRGGKVQCTVEKGDQRIRNGDAVAVTGEVAEDVLSLIHI